MVFVVITAVVVLAITAFAFRRPIRRAARAGKILVRDPRVPRWANVALGVCFLPIPGPLDELGAVALAVILWRVAPGPMQEAWQQAGG
ncbi:MAG: hypothetical protein ACR2KV_09675 [Solirubrobacteraceae bacterium]